MMFTRCVKLLNFACRLILRFNRHGGDVIRTSTAVSKRVLVRLMRLCYSFTRQLLLAGGHEEAIKGDCEGKYVITSDFRFLPIVSH